MKNNDIGPIAFWPIFLVLRQLLIITSFFLNKRFVDLEGEQGEGKEEGTVLSPQCALM